ncbi:hypothetical protein RM844_10180 [Streptomyces sp. DSM 44915]|uniref:Uncharacterized protein n=1 Tax=Streptomyces chisholmiae TaxID=3075540 RepID=A0ABU2JQ63_9ACTN|nr:hypothetical protein [Streptomyces sp. DSM 44915]MDT0266659.1 hypothetical protein [Streptomyces sp. DSM 44915]
MDDEERVWITAVPPFGPAEVGVLLAVDVGTADVGERLTHRLLNRGHEGEEGVFYLLADDLAARYERAGGRLAVSLLAHRSSLAAELAADGDAELAAGLAALPTDPVDPARVRLLRREITTDFDPAGPDAEPSPVLLIDHLGPAPLPELFAAFGRGEASLAVLPAEGP